MPSWRPAGRGARRSSGAAADVDVSITVIRTGTTGSLEHEGNDKIVVERNDLLWPSSMRELPGRCRIQLTTRSNEPRSLPQPVYGRRRRSECCRISTSNSDDLPAKLAAARCGTARTRRSSWSKRSPSATGIPGRDLLISPGRSSVSCRATLPRGGATARGVLYATRGRQLPRGAITSRRPQPICAIRRRFTSAWPSQWSALEGLKYTRHIPRSAIPRLSASLRSTSSQRDNGGARGQLR